MSNFTLIIEFVKIGLLSIGGGLATLPFLYELTEKYTWITPDSLSQMIAISESTPGALGVNMSTYVGYSSGGILGGICATVALVTPSLFIIIFISSFLDKFQQNTYVKRVFDLLRPVVVGLIAVAGFNILNDVLLSHDTDDLISINPTNILLFCLLYFAYSKFKLHPIFYIILSGFIGVILSL